MRWLKSLFGQRKPTEDPQVAARIRQEADWQRLLADWPYPLRLVPGAQAAAVWQDEAAIGAREGFSPIIITPGTPQLPKEPADEADTPIEAPDAIVDAYVRSLIYENWALKRPGVTSQFRNALPEEVAAALASNADYANGGAYAYEAAAFENTTEIPPPPAEHLTFESLRSHELNGPFPQLAITRLPVAESWRAALLFQFGGWNSAPGPKEVAAFARRWKQLHGANIACITDDTLELAVEHPPTTFEAAKRLAQEHMLLCGEGLADVDLNYYIATLRSRRSWFFWWD
ncbi:DUF4253 domain-containing protein [Xanthobacter autotrophicus]|uniref:DUF4253 domain-containing protein n=1 Tax=Xanthobacter autotrophicus TaxID=280 RepID=UPI0037281CD1